METVSLLVSEVVTNAILHARSDIELNLVNHGARLRIEVRDGTGGEPAVRRFRDDAASGRGLAIVERLATAWGVTHLTDGKLVWFEIAAG